MAYHLYFLGKLFTLTTTVELDFYSHYQFHSIQVSLTTQVVNIFLYSQCCGIRAWETKTGFQTIRAGTQ